MNLTIPIYFTAIFGFVIGAANSSAQQALATGEAVSAPQEYVAQVLSVIREITELGELEEKGLLGEQSLPQLKKLNEDLEVITNNPDLLRLPLAPFDGKWLHYTAREGVTNAFSRYHSQEETADFDSKVLLIDSIGVTFETDWYGFSNTFVYLLNEKFRSPQNYEKAVLLLAKHSGGCSADYGAIRSVAEICIADIGRAGFSSMGAFPVALEWAREEARFLEKLNIQSREIQVRVLLALAELEHDHGSKANALMALDKMPEFSDSDIVEAEYGSGNFLSPKQIRDRAQSLRTKIEQDRSRSVSKTDGDIVEVFVNRDGNHSQPETISNGAQALVLMRKGSLPASLALQVQGKIDQLIAENNIGRRTGRQKLSANAREDLAVLAGIHLSIMFDQNIDKFAAFLFERNYSQKNRLAAPIYDLLYEDLYGQWGDDLGFFEDIEKIAQAMDVLEYPLAAQVVRENMMRIFDDNIEDGARKENIKLSMPEIFMRTHLALAEFNIKGKRYEQARKSLLEIVRIAEQRFEKEWKGGRQDIGTTISALQPIIAQTLDIWNQLSKADNKLPSNEAFETAFKLAQLSQLGDVALAMQAGIRKAVIGTSPTGELLREFQDLADNAEHLAELENALGYFMKDGISAAAAKEKQAVDKSSETLGDLLPFIEEFSGVAPVSPDRISNALHENEVAFLIAPGTNSTAVFAIARDHRQYAVAEFSNNEILTLVRRLRASLDPVRSDISDPATFDVDGALALYKALVLPVEQVLQAKPGLIATLKGPMASVPISLLLSSSPDINTDGKPDLVNARWLVRDHAVSISPSLSSFVAARNKPPRLESESKKPILGLGDPVFSHTSAGAETLADASSRSLSAYFRGASANLDTLSTLVSLPETREELTFVSEALGGEQRDILLGSDATETKLGEMNANGQLRSYRVVYFATHGLVAGELDGENEPALVLTLPQTPSTTDDGLLTASEVAKLKLDADWVVLSACNTAASEGEGTEAFSGLVKSFFNAGARTVLASHWPVLSSAAVDLTTGTFAKLASEPALGKPEALRRTQLDLISEGGSKAHPGYWAPFVLAGEL